LGVGIVRDPIHVLSCDFDLNADNAEHQAELTSCLDGLRILLMEALSEEEVWIVYHPVTRIMG
jgi:hypothetical protein